MPPYPSPQLRGDQIGRLIPQGPVRLLKDRSAGWGCLCECGNWTVVRTGELNRYYAPTKSCGCGRKAQKPLLGLRFGRLTVMGPARMLAERQATWGCQCDCGRWTFAMSWQLEHGTIQSCGCARRQPRKIRR